MSCPPRVPWKIRHQPQVSQLPIASSSTAGRCTSRSVSSAEEQNRHCSLISCVVCCLFSGVRRYPTALRHHDRPRSCSQSRRRVAHGVAMTASVSKHRRERRTSVPNSLKATGRRCPDAPRYALEAGRPCVGRTHNTLSLARAWSTGRSPNTSIDPQVERRAPLGPGRGLSAAPAPARLRKSGEIDGVENVASSHA